MSIYLYMCVPSDDDDYKNALLFYNGQYAIDFVIRYGSVQCSRWKLSVLQIKDDDSVSEFKANYIPQIIQSFSYNGYASYKLSVNSIVWRPANDSMFGIKHQNDWYLINLNLKDGEEIYARNIIAEKVDFMGEF